MLSFLGKNYQEKKWFGTTESYSYRCSLKRQIIFCWMFSRFVCMCWCLQHKVSTNSDLIYSVKIQNVCSIIGYVNIANIRCMIWKETKQYFIRQKSFIFIETALWKLNNQKPGICIAPVLWSACCILPGGLI